MYGILVGLHNITRWLVLFAAIYALYAAYSGLFAKKAYDPTGRQAGVIYGAITGIQLILGMIVYFWPGGLVMSLLSGGGMAAAMRDSQLRFFAVEHIAMMTIAVGLVHMGNGIARRGATDTAKYRRAAIFWTIATLLIVFSIPWWRPLFPGL